LAPQSLKALVSGSELKDEKCSVDKIALLVVQVLSEVVAI
jgi:hypothetical protein